jgi:hypothetical protein
MDKPKKTSKELTPKKSEVMDRKEALKRMAKGAVAITGIGLVAGSLQSCLYDDYYSDYYGNYYNYYNYYYSDYYNYGDYSDYSVYGVYYVYKDSQ